MQILRTTSVFEEEICEIEGKIGSMVEIYVVVFGIFFDFQRLLCRRPSSVNSVRLLLVQDFREHILLIQFKWIVRILVSAG